MQSLHRVCHFAQPDRTDGAIDRHRYIGEGEQEVAGSDSPDSGLRRIGLGVAKVGLGLLGSFRAGDGFGAHMTGTRQAEVSVGPGWQAGGQGTGARRPERRGAPAARVPGRSCSYGVPLPPRLGPAHAACDESTGAPCNVSCSRQSNGERRAVEDDHELCEGVCPRQAVRNPRGSKSRPLQFPVRTPGKSHVGAWQGRPGPTRQTESRGQRP